MSHKLVIAIDVGTTFSGVSYAFKDDTSQEPEIHGVTRFPGFMGADSKIPSQVLYRQTPAAVVPHRFGAEVDEFEQETAEDPDVFSQDYIKVQWFKILLRPGHLSPPSEIKTQLPVEINAIQVFSDYLRYLHKCTMDFIRETHINSDQLFQKIGNNIHYVLTHPNGWVGPQQARIRAAAVDAGLVANPSDNRLHLLTEGEASINFCIQQDSTRDLISPTQGVAVIDAGGGTIDISAYRRCTASGILDEKIKLEEITDAKCLLQGSIFVTWNAEQYLKDKLRNSKFKGETENIAHEFDRMTKLRFRSSESSQFIKFGRMGDTEKESKISNGRIELPGKEIAKFFEPSVDAIVETFQDIRNSSPGTPITRALLVGGFASSQYLYTEVKKRLTPLGIELYRPDRHLNKAVANGAIAYFLNRSVVARVSKHTLGTFCSVLYNEANPEHRKRLTTKSFISKGDGHRYVGGVFQPIIAKGTSVKDNGEMSEYSTNIRHIARDGCFEPVLSSSIVEYRGSLPGIGHQWVDEEPDNYETLCDMKCRLSDRTLKELKNLPQTAGAEGYRYVECLWEISLVLGAPEMSAHGVFRYQPKQKQQQPIEIKSEPRIVYFDRDDEVGDWED